MEYRHAVASPEIPSTETVSLQLTSLYIGNNCSSLYQSLSMGGLRMVDIELTIKSLRLTWIKRPLDNCNCRAEPDYLFFNKYGDLNFLLRCNYDSNI